MNKPSHPCCRRCRRSHRCCPRPCCRFLWNGRRCRFLSRRNRRCRLRYCRMRHRRRCSRLQSCFRCRRCRCRTRQVCLMIGASSCFNRARAAWQLGATRDSSGSKRRNTSRGSGALLQNSQPQTPLPIRPCLPALSQMLRGRMIRRIHCHHLLTCTNAKPACVVAQPLLPPSNATPVASMRVLA